MRKRSRSGATRKGIDNHVLNAGNSRLEKKIDFARPTIPQKGIPILSPEKVELRSYAQSIGDEDIDDVADLHEYILKKNKVITASKSDIAFFILYLHFIFCMQLCFT